MLLPAPLQSSAPLASDGVAADVLDLVGKTPVVRLGRLFPSPGPEVFAKLESFNPGGSTKDRPAQRMIADALRSGRLSTGGLVVESTSGNMGVGLAQACVCYGLRLVCVVDPRIQPANAKLIEAYGGRLEWVTQPDPQTGDFLKARLDRVRTLLESEPEAFWPNQYANLANPAAHRDGTARELVEQLGPDLSAVFVAVSSTGTLRGFEERLARAAPGVELIAVDSTGSVLFGGASGDRIISGMGAGTVSELARGAPPDCVTRVSDLDCVVGCRRLARTEGVLAGGSAGGVITAIQRWRQCSPHSGRVAAVLADGGGRYLDTIYDDDWVHRTLGVSPSELNTLVAGDLQAGSRVEERS